MKRHNSIYSWVNAIAGIGFFPSNSVLEIAVHNSNIDKQINDSFWQEKSARFDGKAPSTIFDVLPLSFYGSVRRTNIPAFFALEKASNANCMFMFRSGREILIVLGYSRYRSDEEKRHFVSIEILFKVVPVALLIFFKEIFT